MHERRSIPRPSLWLNLLLLILATATFAFARYERKVVERKTALLFRPSSTNPEELNRIREQLADMDLDRRQLAQELDGRMQYIQSREGEQFYIAIDTAKQTLEFRIGKDVVRQMPVTTGPTKTIKARDGRTWTFVPLKGGFNIEGKVTDYTWPVPDWVYAMNGQSPPATPVSVANGLGKYVIRLPSGYVIQSPPPAGGPLQGPKPGSYEVPEADLGAIWPRVTTDTRVYIF